VKITIDKEKCFLSGECYYNHPELFQADDDGAPVVMTGDLSIDAIRKHAQEAAEVCPAVAIHIEE